MREGTRVALDILISDVFAEPEARFMRTGGRFQRITYRPLSMLHML